MLNYLRQELIINFGQDYHHNYFANEQINSLRLARHKIIAKHEVHESRRQFLSTIALQRKISWGADSTELSGEMSCPYLERV